MIYHDYGMTSLTVSANFFDIGKTWHKSSGKVKIHLKTRLHKGTLYLEKRLKSPGATELELIIT